MIADDRESRKPLHVGRIDPLLLARVDARAQRLGQTRRIYVERSLRAVIHHEEEYERGPEPAAA